MRWTLERLIRFRLGMSFSALALLSGCGDGSPSRSVETSSPASAGSAEIPRSNILVGSETCAECHEEQHASYLNTAHSRSLSVVDLESEPADGEFFHELSGHWYQIYREAGGFRHRQWVESAEGETVSVADYPVQYLIGSGRHTRSYLIDVDGFLMESQITWYASRNEWDLSPGYDVPLPIGFERAADTGCLACHVGEATAVDGSMNRITVRELAIGCERCHGAGAEHVEYHRDGLEGADPIANPGTMSRELVESLCAQCHLRGDATVFHPGLGPMDHVPGDPLSATRIDYRLNDADSGMKVVGHIEQMWRSRCYSESETLSCTTCHQLHSSDDASIDADFYRARCMNCHAIDECGLPSAAPARSEVGDDCRVCHMPQSETDIPHIAFTHHRIGIHRDGGRPEPPDRGLELVSLVDTGHLPQHLRDRSLGLAYLEVSERAPDLQTRSLCQERALALLQRSSQQGEADGDLQSALARLYWELRPEIAIEAARSALTHEHLSPEARVNANFVLADMYFESEQWSQALEPLQELIRLRRHSEDWLLLGITRHATGRDDAVETLETAIEINPFRDDILETLGAVLEREGRLEDAGRFHQRAEDLRRSQARLLE